MLDSAQNTFDFHSDPSFPIVEISTRKTVEALREANEDFEYYPSTQAQIQTIVSDLIALSSSYDITERRSDAVKVLDVGAGDGRVLNAFEDAFKPHDIDVKKLAVERASVHINSYRGKNINLLGTVFQETNFLSKNTDVAFVNPPYSQFSFWVSTLIQQLNFKVLYAIIPTRWKDSEEIKEAMRLRGLKFSFVLDKSDFYNAERQARAHVELVRFSFTDLEKASDPRIDEHRHYKPCIGKNSTDPFQQFLDKELGLKKTHSNTTNKFNEYVEKERIKKAMSDETTRSYELVQSEGVLPALLDNYERDMEHILNQYKKISELDGDILAELGVEHSSIKTGVTEKLYGMRNVYWSTLFDSLDAIHSRLTSDNKTKFLNTLKSNSLDFTYKNALYVIDFAVKEANELIEDSLTSVYQVLTSESSISRYYVSNERVYKDDWRYNRYDGYKPQEECKRVLDYRFIYSSWSNFGQYDFQRGLNESAAKFTDDLMVVFRLLGYSNVRTDKAYQEMSAGGKIVITGTDTSGTEIELLHIKYYGKGTRHLKFDSHAMLRFNVAVAKILGWCRSREEYAQETQAKTNPSESVWSVADDMRISPNAMLKLAVK